MLEGRGAEPGKTVEGCIQHVLNGQEVRGRGQVPSLLTKHRALGWAPPGRA